MSERCCGTCKWAGTFNTITIRKIDYCQGICLFPVPFWIKLDRMIKLTDGQHCPTYEERDGGS